MGKETAGMLSMDKCLPSAMRETDRELVSIGLRRGAKLRYLPKAWRTDSEFCAMEREEHSSCSDAFMQALRAKWVLDPAHRLANIPGGRWTDPWRGELMPEVVALLKADAEFARDAVHTDGRLFEKLPEAWKPRREFILAGLTSKRDGIFFNDVGSHWLEERPLVLEWVRNWGGSGFTLDGMTNTLLHRKFGDREFVLTAAARTPQFAADARRDRVTGTWAWVAEPAASDAAVLRAIALREQGALRCTWFDAPNLLAHVQADPTLVSTLVEGCPWRAATLAPQRISEKHFALSLVARDPNVFSTLPGFLQADPDVFVAAVLRNPTWAVVTPPAQVSDLNHIARPQDGSDSPYTSAPLLRSPGRFEAYDDDNNDDTTLPRRLPASRFANLQAPTHTLSLDARVQQRLLQWSYLDVQVLARLPVALQGRCEFVAAAVSRFPYTAQTIPEAVKKLPNFERLGVAAIELMKQGKRPSEIRTALCP